MTKRKPPDVPTPAHLQEVRALCAVLRLAVHDDPAYRAALTALERWADGQLPAADLRATRLALHASVHRGSGRPIDDARAELARAWIAAYHYALSTRRGLRPQWQADCLGAVTAARVAAGEAEASARVQGVYGAAKAGE